jgi:hypothetical protein
MMLDIIRQQCGRLAGVMPTNVIIVMLLVLWTASEVTHFIKSVSYMFKV